MPFQAPCRILPMQRGKCHNIVRSYAIKWSGEKWENIYLLRPLWCEACNTLYLIPLNQGQTFTNLRNKWKAAVSEIRLRMWQSLVTNTAIPMVKRIQINCTNCPKSHKGPSMRFAKKEEQKRVTCTHANRANVPKANDTRGQLQFVVTFPAQGIWVRKGVCDFVSFRPLRRITSDKDISSLELYLLVTREGKLWNTNC